MNAAGATRRLASAVGLTIDYGLGHFLYTSGGSRLFDAVTGYGVAGFGHGHATWTAGLCNQLGKLVVSPLRSSLRDAYLDRLSSELPGSLTAVALFSGGAEAVEAACRVAQSATGRRHVVSFADAFHGKTAGVRGLGKVGSANVINYPACTAHDATTYFRCGDASPDSMQQLECVLRSGDVAAMVFEPVLGTAGNLPPDAAFFRTAADACRAAGVVVVADECLTGTGRLGFMLGCTYYRVTPDVVVLGKALGGGFPLSAVAVRPDLWQASELAAPSGSSTSYGGNPLACAAGLSVLKILHDESIYERVGETSEIIRSGLVALARDDERVSMPRGVGAMTGFDQIDRETGALAGVAQCQRLLKRLVDAGMLVAADVPRVRLYPPLTLGRREAELFALKLYDVVVSMP